MMMCPMGTAPMPLQGTSNETVRIDGLAIATIADCVPFANIPPFGTCNILTAAPPCLSLRAGAGGHLDAGVASTKPSTACRC